MSIIHLTAEYSATYASFIRDYSSQHSIVVPASSDLARILEALDWFGSFPPDSFQPETAFEADKSKALRLFLYLDQGVRIAIALKWSLTLPGSDLIAKRLTSPLDRLATQDETAQDLFFELDIAQKLLSRGAKVRIGEPDILLTFGDTEVGIACKRPRGLKGIGKRIHQGVSQLRKNGVAGFVVVGLESIFHRPPTPGIRPILYESDDQESFRVHLTRIADQAFMRSKAAVAYAFSQDVLGVLFCGMATALSKQPSAYISMGKKACIQPSASWRCGTP